MASESSFDVVSDFDRQELVNAVDIARREIQNRFDLKGSGSEILLEDDKLILKAGSEYQIKAVFDILESKAIKRGLSLKIFDLQKVDSAALGTFKQEVLLRKGLTADQCRELNKKIRAVNPKVRVQVQDDTVRVFSKSRDDLQAMIAFLKALEYEAPLQFENYR